MFKYLVSFILFLMPITLLAEDFIAGKDYVIIETSDKLENSKISVTEFFSYGCPWCYRLEPALNIWINQQGKKIIYNRIPVIFNKSWEYYAKAYYTIQALELDAQLTPILFKAILTDKKTLNSDQAMVDFLINQGVNATTAQSAFYHSPTIDLEIETGKKQMILYGINAIPALVINHRYKTDLQMAKTGDRLFAILDFLIAKDSKN